MHFPRMHTCTHKEATLVPKCVDRERSTGSGHKAKLELARGGHCKGRLEGRGAGDPEMPRLSIILPDSIPIVCPR